MSNKNTLASLRRSREDEYFLEREQELISKLRRRASLEAELTRLAETRLEAGQEILRDLEELGYTRSTLSLLHIVPLVYVAWSKGFVTDRERELIFRAARLRGIDDESDAWKQLDEWLTRRPSEQFFETNLGIIETLLHGLPPEAQAAAKRDLVSYCTQVASVSGGLLDMWGQITPEKQAAIDHVAAELEHEHYTASREMIEGQQ